MCCFIIVRSRFYNEQSSQPLKNALIKWLQRKYSHLFDDRDILSDFYESLSYAMPVINVPTQEAFSSVSSQANKSASSYASDVSFYQYK
jgi:hypothetical protein